ncbi:MAG TPA: hypothetical protein VD907_04470 [Verrucomicrobiae bacterium]|nr:hypothetical protein [Verrucomicrobiae bacterium]
MLVQATLAATFLMQLFCVIEGAAKLNEYASLNKYEREPKPVYWLGVTASVVGMLAIGWYLLSFNLASAMIAIAVLQHTANVADCSHRPGLPGSATHGRF